MLSSYEQSDFIKRLNSYLNPENRETIGEGFYEWKIEDWASISKKKKIIFSPEFEACGYKWRIQIFTNGDPNVDYSKKYISIYLERLNPEEDLSVHIPLNRVFYIRNYYDENCFYYKTLPIEFYSYEYNTFGLSQLIKRTDLYTKNNYTNKALLENNKCVFGVYFHMYNYNIENDFKKELICAWDNEPENNEGKHVIEEKFYEMEIENWDELPECKLSPEFTVGNHKWNLELHKNGYDPSFENSVSYYLNCVDFENDNENDDESENKDEEDNDDENEETGVCTKYVLFMRNCDNKECFVYGGFDFIYFNDKGASNGFNEFLENSQLKSLNKKVNKPLLENNKCIIGAYVQVYEEGNDDGDYNTLSNMVNNINIGNNNDNCKPNMENNNGYSDQPQVQPLYNYPPNQYPQDYNYPPNQYPQDYSYPPNQYSQDYNYPPYQYPQDYNYPPYQYPQDYNYPPYQYPQDYNYPPYQYSQDYNYSPYQNPEGYYNGPPNSDQTYYYQEQNYPYYYRNKGKGRGKGVKPSIPSKQKEKLSE